MKKILIMFLPCLINITQGNAKIIAKPTDTVVINFIYQATLQSLQEMNNAKYALANAKRSDVRSFATEAHKAYARVSEKLNAIINKNKYQIPAHIDQSVAPDVKLTGDPSENFDNKYLSLMAKDNEKMMDLYSRALKVFNDADLINFIKHTLPLLEKQHKAIGKLLENKN